MAKATKSKPRARRNGGNGKPDTPSVFQFVPGDPEHDESRAAGPDTGSKSKDALLIGIMRVLNSWPEEQIAEVLLALSSATRWTVVPSAWRTTDPGPPPARKREREAQEE